MKQTPRYLRHAPFGTLLLAAFRVAGCFGAVMLCAGRIGRAILTGEIKVPMRGASIIVTTASPDWFALAILAWLLITVFFVFLTVLFARQLVETHRS